MKTRTPANAMRTIRLVCEELFCSFEAGGAPSAFPRFLAGAGGGTPKNGRVGDVEGDNDGAIVVEFNWFPSFLHHQCKHEQEPKKLVKHKSRESTYRNLGMLSSLSGMGPEKRLFSMFLLPRNTLKLILLSLLKIWNIFVRDKEKLQVLKRKVLKNV